MPHAVTHFLIPAILIALFRDFLSKKQKRSFPLHYVLIGGLAGLLPDLDIAVYYILSFFGFTLSQVHRTFSHNLFVPLIFIIIGLIFHYTKINNPELGKHKMKLSIIFLLLSFGVLIHLLLDVALSGTVNFFYPFTNLVIGLNLLNLLPEKFQSTIIPTIDAAILILWMIYMEAKHKISNFI